MVVYTMSGAAVNVATWDAAVINNTPNVTKEKKMKKHCVRILSVFFGLAALAIVAKGQTIDQIVVNVPYEFVVAGKTLPAGTYRVHRIDESNVGALAISSSDTGAAVLVLPTEVIGQARTAEPSLIFQQVGEQHLLSKIQTDEHVFTIPVSSPR
jgi:hypothetical protein